MDTPAWFRVAALLWIAAIALPSAVAVAEDKTAERPNIIFVFTDDHATHAISAYGSKINKTPNIDRLAEEGMLFRNCFCTNSICGPSRAVILTGKHSHLNGFRVNGDRFDGSQQTFPKLLQKAGYETAVIGKWHLETDPTGFDHWNVLIGQGPYYNPPMKSASGVTKHVGYTTDVITDFALDWLDKGRDKQKPFMLMYQHKAPHRNWMPGPDHLTMYDDVTIPEPATLFDDYEGRTSAAKKQQMTIVSHMNDHDLKLAPQHGLTPEQQAKWDAAYEPKNEAFRQANLQGDDLVRWKYQRYIKDYLRCVASVDDGIGKLLEYLDDNDLADNTVVIYSSDQGFYLGDHGWYDKRWMYEESLRMPFIVRWPGKINPGSENQHLVQNLDFAETFLDLAGVKIPADMQGRSLKPLFLGESVEWRDAIYYHYFEFPGTHAVQRHNGVRTDRYKLIRYYLIDEWELFDLEKDPDELKSVYDDPAYAPVVKEMKAKLDALKKQYQDEDSESWRRGGPQGKKSQSQLRKEAQNAQAETALEADIQRADTKINHGFDPSAKPLTVGAWVRPQQKDGVILAHGGGAYGYAIYLKDGLPHFTVRDGSTASTVQAEDAIAIGKWTHVVGRLNSEGKLQLLINGSQVAQGEGLLLSQKPAEGISIGNDTGDPVGDYESINAFTGKLEQVRIYAGPVAEDVMSGWVGSEPQ